MVNVVFVSLYLRTDEYPQKYTLSSMRLASYIMSREYIQHLKDENKRLEEQNKLKNEYLKKVVGR